MFYLDKKSAAEDERQSAYAYLSADERVISKLEKKWLLVQQWASTGTVC